MQISFGNGVQFGPPKIETRICSLLQDVSILVELNPLTPELNPSAQRCVTRFI
jgi:hypothetical protein